MSFDADTEVSEDCTVYAACGRDDEPVDVSSECAGEEWVFGSSGIHGWVPLEGHKEDPNVWVVALDASLTEVIDDEGVMISYSH